MKTLGVTGGIGSGKTTVCRFFETLGARVFYADAEAKRLMEEDPGARAEIVEAFGPQSYDADGRLDRAYLARTVFSDEENVRRINAIVHPRVFRAFEEAKRRAERDGVDLLVHEAALIFEAGGDQHLDAVAVVDAPEAERVRRVVERDDVQPAQVRARMGHQLPPAELRRRADYVIENAGSLEDLRAQVEAVYRQVLGKTIDQPSSSFKDHFSAHASEYVRYRPRYPEALFAYLAALCRAHELAWDCGTGNGQAALGLAPHFTRIVATDASADQIAHATPHPRVEYHVAPDTRSPLAAGTADLVAAAQAVHWFDFDGFYAEVRRVLKHGGVLAVWTYGRLYASPAVDGVIARYFREVVGPYWPPERRLVDACYRTLPFPFEEVETPAFDIDMSWRLADLIGYLGTWSASQRYRRERGADPVDVIRGDLGQAWGAPDALKTIRWPLHLRVGRV